MEGEGHYIKFAVSRGPLNIATFLADTTEFLIAFRSNPDEAKKLLETVTDFIIDWLKVQAETFTSTDGILILDDIVGFLGEDDFRQFALPYLSRIFDSLDVAVKFFHNDAGGLVCAPYLPQIGVNMYNFSSEHTLVEMKKLTDNSVVLVGNIPPRDVLAAGTPEQVQSAVKAALDLVSDKSRIIISAGGGMSSGVSTENIEAVLSAVK